MKAKVTFTDADKAYLLEKIYGGGKEAFEADLPQIERAAKVTTYTLTEGEKSLGRISLKEAVARLGREKWLSGLSRSAFHWTAARETADGKGIVFFDSSKLFK